ncbi:IS66 family transposase [Phaeospirillum tilakii]|uniref:Transposase n=1 Tax=Phaeospirillum tilakii TaxID=741673 RepID=A0ABW5C7C7_9PROT
MVKPPFNLDAFPPFTLKPLTLGLLEENARLTSENASLREEIARLKGLKGKPDIKPPSKPSGMETATEKRSRGGEKPRRGPKKPSVPIEDRVVSGVDIPPGSRFKGYEDFTLQDLKIEPQVVRYRRERWLTPDGRTVLAPLPAGVSDHFGPEIKRFILAQYHQGQTTVPRLVELLQMLGVDISKRQVVRILTEANDAFIAEARDVLRAGLTHGRWISVDDTGARHQGKNGFCTQIGNDAFTFFATTGSKSRANFLGLLRAGHGDYVLNDQAFSYLRRRHLAGPVIALLAAHPARHFADQAAWNAHLAALGITTMKAHPNPVVVATEGALWGAITAHRFIDGTVIVSDDAGQFNVGEHALCWVHAERLVYKLDTFTEAARKAKEIVRALICWLYADLKAYRAAPDPHRKAELKPRFDRLFKRRTGFASLDRLLARLHANKAELLRILDRPEIPLHTNGSENDIRCQVIRRKVSGTTRSDPGRDCRDAFLGLAKTCRKLGVSFWEFLGTRLGADVVSPVPSLPTLVAARLKP